jgi:hypothetical protein
MNYADSVDYADAFAYSQAPSGAPGVLSAGIAPPRLVASTEDF